MTERTERIGISIPLDEPLGDQLDYFAELEGLGCSDLWTTEVNAMDGLIPLAAAALVTHGLRLGTAIVSSYTRSPACLAQSAATLAQLAPGRFVLGVGSSSKTIVEQWNGIPFDRPLSRTRDVVRFLRLALTGAKVNEDYETFAIRNFRLEAVPEVLPRILVAGLRERMLRMAGEEADGAILNWLSAEDARRMSAIVHSAGREKEVVARLFVCPSTDSDLVRAKAREFIAAYLTVPVYREYQKWLDRGEALGPMWKHWDAGDRKAALAVIPDEVVDDLIVHGTPQHCRTHIERYVASGIDVPVLAVMPWGVDPRQAARELLSGRTEIRASECSV